MDPCIPTTKLLVPGSKTAAPAGVGGYEGRTCPNLAQRPASKCASMFGGRRTLEEEDVYHAANLSDALSALRNGQTRWLVANGKGFNDEDAIRIARALHHNKNLQELSLAGNRIGPEGAEALGQAVGVHPFLKEFYMQKNRLGQEGIERFAFAIQSGGAPRLEVLNTSSNGIGPRFPPGLALPGLKSLIVKNNNIQEIPSCFGECEKLSNVVLDNNPLVSPPMDVYVNNGWLAIRSFLVQALEREKEQNRMVGMGNASNYRRDETLLGPVRKLINRGALQDASMALERARSVYTKINATQELAVVDDIARRLLSVVAMDDASVFPIHLDCCFRAEGASESSSDGFLMSRHVLAEKAPFLSSHLCDSGFDTSVSLHGQNVLRKVVDIGGTSRGGLRCFLAYLLLEDLKQAVAISGRLENLNGEDSEGFSSDSDSESSDTSSSASEGAQRGAKKATPAPRHNLQELPIGGYITTLDGRTPTGGSETTVDTEGGVVGVTGAGEGGEGMRVEEEEERRALNEDLSSDLVILFDAADLGARFGVEGVEQQAGKLLYQRLQPWNVIAALKGAHRRKNEGLKKVCMAFLDEHGTSVEEAQWRSLRAHCDLMMEVMDSLARSDGRPPSARWMVSSVLMRHVLERLERAESKAQRAAELRDRTEHQLRRLQHVLSTAAKQDILLRPGSCG